MKLRTLIVTVMLATLWTGCFSKMTTGQQHDAAADITEVKPPEDLSTDLATIDQVTLIDAALDTVLSDQSLDDLAAPDQAPAPDLTDAVSSPDGSDANADDAEPPFDSAGEFGSACRSSSDCKNGSGLYCNSPGRALCGICMKGGPGCSEDKDCGDQQVCDSGRPMPGCWCGGEFTVCAAPCTDSSVCRLNTSCQNGHCKPFNCLADDECPAYHRCTTPGATTGFCQRRPCKSSSECPSGVCVNHGCYGGYGSCTQPVP